MASRYRQLRPNEFADRVGSNCLTLISEPEFIEGINDSNIGDSYAGTLHLDLTPYTPPNEVSVRCKVLRTISEFTDRVANIAFDKYGKQVIQLKKYVEGRNVVADGVYDGWGELTEFELTNPYHWKMNVLASIREICAPAPENPSFHVVITVHGRSFTDKQIDLLSVFGYVIRLGAGSKSPHDPVVVSRFVDFVADGVECLDQAVERAHYEVSAALDASQHIFAVHAMAEERWYECEMCREDTLNEHTSSPTDEFTLDAPPRTGNRRSALRFLENLPGDLTGKRVTVNVEGCWATTSFVHETMLEVVTRRNANRLTFVGANNEFAELAYFCTKDDDTLLKCVFLGDSEIAASAESDSEDILDTLGRWLVDDEFCENTNAETLIAAAVEEIKRLREAGDNLADKMRSGSDTGWDDAIDKCEELR